MEKVLQIREHGLSLEGIYHRWAAGKRNDILYGSVYGQHGDRCRAGICQYADPCGGCAL